jgi:hypothetical protein
LQTGHAGRDLIAGEGEGGQPQARLDAMGQVFEAEETIAVAGRRSPVVEHGYGQHVDLVEIQAEGAEDLSQGSVVKVKQPQAADTGHARCFVFAYDLDTHGCYLVQVVVEGTGCIGRGKDAVTSLEMVSGRSAPVRVASRMDWAAKMVGEGMTSLYAFSGSFSVSNNSTSCVPVPMSAARICMVASQFGWLAVQV